MQQTNAIEIIARTLSMIDLRLIDHGRNVALFTCNAMRAAGKYTEKEIDDMCLIALFHDIGAFKTEEISRLVAFDAENSWEHSIYGYLFIKRFSPLAHLAPVVLLHHTSPRFMDTVPEPYRELAQILHIADRMEISSRFGGHSAGDLVRYFADERDKLISSGLVSLFSRNEGSIDRDEMWNRICHAAHSRSDIEDYLKMLVLSIDFRSRHTVTHTVSTAEFSGLMAELFSLRRRERACIAIGALLHDIGKAGIPVEILEKPGCLDSQETEIMRSHVPLTEQLLRGRVDERVERIACRHHEKLDGSGYPQGLCAPELTFAERVVAVTDILSALCGARSYKDVFPKERVVSILTDMSARGKLDGRIVRKIVDSYDFLMERTALVSDPVTRHYEQLASEYDHMLESISDMRETGNFQLAPFCDV
ncbi:MAG: HD domain-containing protein [Synergistaceae bacterium]|jgi:putative nucleotidyltransferase with HDIG domain|nr:HD domain-containing protein [Synergistaceae bacterium]